MGQQVPAPKQTLVVANGSLLSATNFHASFVLLFMITHFLKSLLVILWLQLNLTDGVLPLDMINLGVHSVSDSFGCWVIHALYVYIST